MSASRRGFHEELLNPAEDRGSGAAEQGNRRDPLICPAPCVQGLGQAQVCSGSARATLPWGGVLWLLVLLTHGIWAHRVALSGLCV